MKTLFQRLSKENQERILEHARIYPTSMKIAVDALNEKTNYYELTLSEYSQICMALKDNLGLIEFPTQIFQ